MAKTNFLGIGSQIIGELHNRAEAEPGSAIWCADKGICVAYSSLILAYIAGEITESEFKEKTSGVYSVVKEALEEG